MVLVVHLILDIEPRWLLVEENLEVWKKYNQLNSTSSWFYIRSKIVGKFSFVPSTIGYAT